MYCVQGTVLKLHPDGAYCQAEDVENSLGHFSKIREE